MIGHAGRCRLRVIGSLYQVVECRGFLDDLTFQGGTSLRLCHGAPRFSEDLDFSGGPGFEAERMAGLADAPEKGLAERCGLDASVTLPKSSRRRALSEGVSVSSWRIAIPFPSGGSGLPALRVRLDIDNAPSHTRAVRRMARHHAVLPDLDLLVAVQSREEVLANTLVAFPPSVATRDRPHYRDVWDMHWLRANGTEIRMDLLQAKTRDHRTPLSWLEDAVGRAGVIVRSPAFSAESRRFVRRNAVLNATKCAAICPFVRPCRFAVTKVRNTTHKGRKSHCSPKPTSVTLCAPVRLPPRHGTSCYVSHTCGRGGRPAVAPPASPPTANW